ncbi:hypothetical protein DOM21_16145 [Bacteriovorax stolpii]|nr:hypothetical protein DOM21_16145 [Bacteriovorax stolpii]
MILAKEEKKQKIKACILGNLQDDNLGYYYIDMIDYFYSSTEAQIRAKAKVEGNLWGIIPEIPKAILERLEKCAEI